MLGAIIGDIVGSRFEGNNIKSKKFEFFSNRCHYTDDTVMTCAVADALLNNKDIVETLQLYGRTYPHRGYGGSFGSWIWSKDAKPYNSWGNGSAMRVSAAGYLAKSVQEAKQLARKTAEVTHNHPEGLKGAETIAVCVYLARQGADKDTIRDYAISQYPEIKHMDYQELLEHYSFDVSCQGSVPQAIFCFLISENFIDCIRTVISIGGDSDTLGAMAGAIAEAYYGIPEEVKEIVLKKYFYHPSDKKLLEPVLEIYKLENNA